ncbi:MAG: hypothetical protein J6P57_02365 [Lachnospiraceae bacterium]|nr:hypothetical protein [Lachnospiraceae bacterium]
MTLKELKKYNNIWIYGAGKVGRKVNNILTFLGIDVNGFAVSKFDGTFCIEKEVVEISSINSPNEDTLFIITAADIFHKEIINTLESKGYTEFIQWNSRHLNELWRCAEYIFEDRRRNLDKCCFILAGYKEFLWVDIFDRIERFIPEDIDVCIISSGLYKEELSERAKKNNWSYLATNINSVTIIQNVAMALYEDYKWIYKIDEDMFVTEGAFEGLFNCYIMTEKESGYDVGTVAPVIPVNGYGYKKVLDKLGKVKEYEELFGKIRIGGNPKSAIETNPNAAVFMWKNTMQIDELNRLVRRDEGYSVCGVRFSIGFILMKHDLWDNMQGFFVSGNPDMGSDEEEVCANCIISSKPIIVADNVVVGHFSFGRQTEIMKEYYNDNRDWFGIRGYI